MMSFISAMFILGNQMVGLFVPGATVNMYGQVRLDVNVFRAEVQKVIPPNTIANTTRGNTVVLEIENVMDAVYEYNTAFPCPGSARACDIGS